MDIDSDIRVEHTRIICHVHTLPNGELCLRLVARTFDSLPGVRFGFHLAAGTTQGQAETLAAQITDRCPRMFAEFDDDGAVE